MAQNPMAQPMFGNDPMQQLLAGMQPPQQSQDPPEVRFQVQLQQLQEMGFFNASENVLALNVTNGNVEMAVEWLFNRPG